MTQNLTMPGGRGSNPAMDWAFVDRLRTAWTGKLIIKGIDPHADARLCVEHGVDAIQALALGAKAVGVGRPFLWGLGAFGQAGVDRVLEILQAELKLVMGNCGTQRVAETTSAYVATAPTWGARRK
jgi:isopentenyl diphosphate isomerase/L-lactate dehydrogenase-like FMN-dependent dehydrogenase